MPPVLFFNKVAGLLFNKVAGLRPATLLKKRLWHRCFPVNFAKFHILLQNTSSYSFIKKESLAQVFSCEHRTPPVAASVCFRRKVAAVKIEKLKGFIIKYYNISKTYSVKLYPVNLSYFYFFIHDFQSSILNTLKNTHKTVLNGLFWLLTLLVFQLVLSKHNYLIYENKQYKSCNLKPVKHKV